MTVNLSVSTKVSPPVVQTRKQVLARMHRADREFLPAALEVLETPPSPLTMQFVVLIFVMVTAALVWAYFGRIDIVADAQGKIQPVGRIKVVQALDTGKVRSLMVSNSTHVNAGDILVQLEDQEAVADEIASREALSAALGETIRRQAAIYIGKSGDLTPPTILNWPDEVTEIVKNREMRTLSDDLRQVASMVSSLKGQERQKAAAVDRLRKMVTSQSALVDTLKSRVTLRSSLVEKDAGSKVSLIDAMQSMQTEQATLTDEQGQLTENEADVANIPLEIAKTVDAFIADNSEKLNDAEKQADDFKQKLAKASALAGYKHLRSPISGTITALSITTVGQVVASGAELMRIVPDDSPLEVQAYLENKDIGFVEVGQDAIVKIDSFPYTRYGSITGRVTNVSTDAIPQADANQADGDPTANSKLVNQAGGQRVQNLVYPVTLSLDRKAMNVDGRQINLMTGMTVAVEVKTGRRRIMEYLLSPLVDVGSKAIRER